jgi:hypothetical protein
MTLTFQGIEQARRALGHTLRTSAVAILSEYPGCLSSMCERSTLAPTSVHEFSKCRTSPLPLPSLLPSALCSFHSHRVLHDHRASQRGHHGKLPHGSIRTIRTTLVLGECAVTHRLYSDPSATSPSFPLGHGLPVDSVQALQP